MDVLTPLEKDVLNTLTEADQKRVLEEIEARPVMLPMKDRKWPYGKPDRLQPGSNF